MPPMMEIGLKYLTVTKNVLLDLKKLLITF